MRLIVDTLKGAALDTYEHERGLFPGDYRNKAINDDLLDELIEKISG